MGLIACRHCDRLLVVQFRNCGGNKLGKYKEMLAIDREKMLAIEKKDVIK